jgi:hypothetical protein
LDESVQVAPWSIEGEYSVSILHLTTVVIEKKACDKGHESLERAVRVLTEIQSIGREEYSISKEMYHFAFSYPLVDNNHGMSCTTQQGLYASHWQGASLTMDSAFREAKEIFASICPDHPFLTLSKDLEASVHERQMQAQSNGGGDSVDDDGAILQNAMKMIDKDNQTT